MNLQMSSDKTDQMIVNTLDGAGSVNAYLAALDSGDETLPAQLDFAYSAPATPPWTGADSLAIGRLLAFQQSYTAEDDIARSAVDAAAANFESMMDDAHQARVGLGHDFGHCWHRSIPPSRCPTAWAKGCRRRRTCRGA